MTFTFDHAIPGLADHLTTYPTEQQQVIRGIRAIRGQKIPRPNVADYRRRAGGDQDEKGTPSRRSVHLPGLTLWGKSTSPTDSERPTDRQEATEFVEGRVRDNLWVCLNRWEVDACTLPQELLCAPLGPPWSESLSLTTAVACDRFLCPW